MEMNLPPLKGLDGSLSPQPRPSAVAKVLRRSAAGAIFGGPSVTSTLEMLQPAFGFLILQEAFFFSAEFGRVDDHS